MHGKEWTFEVADWKTTLREAQPEDFVYLDPPYIGRHTGYFNSWGENDARELAAVTQGLPGGFALSMWLQNRHRRNGHIEQEWAACDVRVQRHFYHVGSKETYRNEMQEALVIKRGSSATWREGCH
jgi:DNA adenine methylase